MKYRVAWRHAGNETVKKGPETFTSRESAEKVAKAMNGHWPEVEHWVESEESPHGLGDAEEHCP